MRKVNGIPWNFLKKVQIFTKSFMQDLRKLLLKSFQFSWKAPWLCAKVSVLPATNSKQIKLIQTFQLFMKGWSFSWNFTSWTKKNNFLLGKTYLSHSISKINNLQHSQINRAQLSATQTKFKLKYIKMLTK